MDIVPVVSVGVILTATAFDALRDAWMRSESWWRRHIVKWISFYLPLGYIMYRDIEPMYWGPLMLASWLTWRASLGFIGQVKWESMWVRWAKKLFGSKQD